MADKPITREEKYLAYLTGDYTGELPKPITRKEKYLYELCLKGMGGEVSPEEIKNAVNEYLEKNPVKPGATTEQEQQIKQNKTDIASLKVKTSSLKEDISNKITKFYASNQGETHSTDSDNGKIMDMMIYGKSSQDGTPSPENPVEIKSVLNPIVKVVGKNLLNVTLRTVTRNGVTCTNNGDGTYTLNGTATSNTDFYVIGLHDNLSKIALNPEKEYICKGTQDAKIEMYTGIADNTVLSANGKSIQIKNMSDIAFVMYRIRSGSIINNVTVYPQLEEGSVSTDFEPYHEQTVALPYTLNAIPVSSGGNVTIDGQQYIADYVDVERGKLVRMCKKKAVPNNVNWTLQKQSANYNIGYSSNVFNDMASTKETTRKAISNFGSSYSLWTNKFCFGKSNVFWINPYANNGELTSNDINNFLTEHPMEVVYPLITPIEEELTPEEIAAFKALATYYPTTNISVNSEQLDGYTVFNYPISMKNGWDYVKKQLNDNRDYIYDMDTQSVEAYVNSEYAVALTELEV